MANHCLTWEAEYPPECSNGAVAIGNFDGVHLGHQFLVHHLVEQSRRVDGPAVILTFDPHPLVLLGHRQIPELLTTAAERARLLQELGVSHVITLRTVPELLNLSAICFFDRVIRLRLRARALVEGPNFGFGRNREGNLSLLGQLCETSGMTLQVVQPVHRSGEEISSSRVRTALLSGEVQSAKEMLGRNYALAGLVSKGSERGRTIGFPTANLEGVETLIPGDGVYAVRVWGGTLFGWPGAANVGPNPTFAERQRKIEIHLIDYTGDLYGSRLRVEFVKRLRATQRFQSVNELVEQLRRDVQQARSLMESQS